MSSVASSRWPLVALALVLHACSDDDGSIVVSDAGADAGADIDTIDVGDAGDGPPDLGEDLGPGDGGVTDPSLIFRGIEPIGNGRLFVEIRGNIATTKNPVVLLSFLPGMGSEYWAPLVDPVFGPSGINEADRAVAYVDLLAQGRSSLASSDESLVNAANQLQSLGNTIQFMKDRFFTETTRFDLVGHGWGGLMAALYAASNPGSVGRLVLISPYPANIDVHAEWIANYRTDGRHDTRALTDLTNNPQCGRNLDQCAIDSFRIYAVPWVCEGNEDVFFQDLEVFHANFLGDRLVDLDLRNQGDAYDFAAAIAQIQAPTTVLTGDCDPIPEANFQIYTQIPGALRVRFPESGFFPMVESPDAFTPALLEALE
ncbi:MAG: alpha/beta hydrolase [Myxococcales bacterium]|nr:alpha/beta hydrolase [Myxococcales bacterium]